jgi:hypothetical protein
MLILIIMVHLDAFIYLNCVLLTLRNIDNERTAKRLTNVNSLNTIA